MADLDDREHWKFRLHPVMGLTLHCAHQHTAWLRLGRRPTRTSTFPRRGARCLIAFGWIDGRRMKLDEERTMQLIAPRKEQAWAKTYIQRAERLESEGRMQESGRAAIQQAKASGSFDSMAEVDDLIEPEALMSALRAGKAATWWNGAAPSYRRGVLRWIAKAGFHQKRIANVVEHCIRGEKVPNY